MNVLAKRFEPVVPDRFTTGECPTWDHLAGELLWTSIDDGNIHAVNPACGTRSLAHFDSTTGSFGLCRSGRLVVALKHQVILFDRKTLEIASLATLRITEPYVRLNDGKVGPDGAFWIGSMDMRPDKESIAQLYRIDGQGRVTVVTEGLKVSNGLAWSPDGRAMYHSDSRGPWIDRWDFDPETGKATGRRRFAELDDQSGRPDGGSVDSMGCYWSAGPSAGCINRFSPSGELLEKITVPNLRPSMPCFGGANLDTLFVTGLMGGLDEAVLRNNPLCGTVLAASAGVKGLPTNFFND